jgi:hypothetical protein
MVSKDGGRIHRGMGMDSGMVNGFALKGLEDEPEGRISVRNLDDGGLGGYKG